MTNAEWVERWLSEAPILTEDEIDEILELMDLL